MVLDDQVHLPRRTCNFGISRAIAMHARHSAFVGNESISSVADADEKYALRPVRDDPLDDLAAIIKYSKISKKDIPV